MKKLLIPAIIIVFFMMSCSNPGHKLVGTWKVSQVETNFKDTNLPKTIITHIKDEQKQLSFKIINDSVMVVILDNNAHEATWEMDSKSKVISYYFNNQKNVINKLGTWEGSDIVSESITPLGKLTVIFKKQ